MNPRLGIAEAGSGTPDRTDRRVVFIDIARGLSALAVFYSHINTAWIRRDDSIESPITDGFTGALAGPLKLYDQDIGQVAIPMFFLVSGFVVTPIAMRMGSRRFAVNRVLRIYPLLALAVTIAAALLWFGLDPPVSGQLREVSVVSVLTNISLANWVIHPQVVLLGVTWTLVIEMIFYLMIVTLLPVFHRSIILAIALEMTAVHVVMMTHDELGPSWSLFAINMSYLPVVLAGQIIWAVHARRVPLWTGAVFLGLSWCQYIWAAQRGLGQASDTVNLAFGVALLLFLLGLLAEPRLRPRQLWTALSDRSYSLYLLHGPIAFPVLDALYPALPVALAIPLAVAATFVAVEISYRWMERPTHGWARRLTRRRSRHRAARSPAGQLTAQIS